MEIVDFTDKRFNLCKNFLQGRVRGSGQTIYVNLDLESIKGFMGLKCLEDVNAFTDITNAISRAGVQNLIYRINKSIKSLAFSVSKVKQEDGCFYPQVYFIGSWPNKGYWEGEKRIEPILKFEEGLQIIKDAYKFLESVDFDLCAYSYVQPIKVDEDNMATITIDNTGIGFYSDIKRLVKFLNILGYQEEQNYVWGNNISSITFKGVDTKTLKENASIWEFL